MNNKVIIAAAIFLLVFTSTGYTQSSSIGLKVSTLGAGLEVERSFTESIGVRIGANYFPYDHTDTLDDIEYNVDLKLMSVSALLDWHPFKGSFRISGGVLYNGNEIEADAKPSVSYTIGDETYDADDVGTLKGKIDFNEIAPYLGLGWDTSFGKDNGFGFLFELGAIYQGSPDVDLSADGLLANDQTFQNNLAKEEKNLQSDIDDYKFYPVISLGFSYRF
ncbi:MAG TPA: hypothetical protein ENG83_05220 [Nitrospirae bacterium]|nr:hypothetical protein BMS3Abin06_02571 [bacterium BMS3Abin06]HDH11587.1 hypothetical protein [Nitrospirota bacterium]HDZ01956.1 hypothetical protein [Nitrospirota bacterium]